MKEDKFLGAHYGILHIKEGLCLTTYIYINISNIDQKYNSYMYRYIKCKKIYKQRFWVLTWTFVKFLLFNQL